ncbi:MAG: hypothetical protein KAR06_02300 [Deltaproteobacteria bacterium]|nr:hypothetical protein [Deltaproteobacteria bacterium]
MSPNDAKNQTFSVKDCALAAIATGRMAQNARELREILITIPADSIYYHFWGMLLRPGFADPAYNNDFAVWVSRELGDNVLAEKLGIIDPTDYEDLESLRQDIIDIIEERLSEQEHIPWSAGNRQFHFIRSQIVIFDTHRHIDDPAELAPAVSSMSPGSIFYHFIDARRRISSGTDDFRAWLAGYGERYEELCNCIATVDPYFGTLLDIREELALILKEFFDGEGRPCEAQAVPPSKSL